MTGGLNASSLQPSEGTIFFDKSTGVAVDGRTLKTAQAGHCIVEVGRSFVSAGGYHSKVKYFNFTVFSTCNVFCDAFPLS